MEKPDTSKPLKVLKAFQRKTVDYVFRRLYKDGERRFLIADEVGLGKTLVARGIVARAVDHLWPHLDKLGRIDIIYICSNADIARQNINRLNFFDEGEEGYSSQRGFATRLPLLPLYIGDLDKQPLNFVAFTPGTSFHLHSSGGLAKERVLLYHLLREEWEFGNLAAPKNIFQYWVQDRKAWHYRLRRFGSELETGKVKIDVKLHQSYLAELKKNKSARRMFRELTERFKHYRQYKNIPPEDRFLQGECIGELRRVLAETCVNRLEPDIIILDEFQRFKDLLDGDDDAAELAQTLFNYRDEHTEPRVLLLSATPYKPYTLYQESTVDDHYEDFLRTMRFLFDSDEETEALKADLRRYREALYQDGGCDEACLAEAKTSIESRLRRVMVRTERLSIEADRNGMLTDVAGVGGALESADLHGYSVVDNVAQTLQVGDVVEYWKSAPYILNAMDRSGYKIKKAFVDVAKDAEGCHEDLLKALGSEGKGLLSWKEVEAYRELDPSNARMRALMDETIGRGAWELLWVPPSLPYYHVSHGPYADAALQEFSKVLVFSSWQIVPKIIAMLCSYEVERRMLKEDSKTFDPLEKHYSERYRRRARLLDFPVTDGRPDRMNNMVLFYPCMTLATEMDPLTAATSLASDKQPVDLSQLSATFARQIQSLIEPLISRYASSGRKDPAWYWAALALLDREHSLSPVRQWVETKDYGLLWGDMDTSGRRQGNQFDEYVNQFSEMVTQPRMLGEPPDDLVDVLTKVSLASPAVTVLRSLMRLVGKREHGECSLELLANAAWVAFGFRTLLNLPHVISMVRSQKPVDESRYWETVLDYCVLGNLQSALDEYAHVLLEALGLVDKAPSKVINEVASEMHDAISIRTVNYDLDDIAIHKGSKRIRLAQRSMRCRFALRFGAGRGETGREDGKAETRKEQVRQAFNSPFWPFVLASTSVGQEGLDFHQYCMNVFHWNLPSNPVDLEQREGRVHRYKSHAIRRNVAEHFPLSLLAGRVSALSDPWKIFFEMAHQRALAKGHHDDLVPFWAFPGGNHKIRRYVPVYPFSRDSQRLEMLKSSLVTYRLVFGQPRQEDLLDYVKSYLSGQITPETMRDYCIDLSPLEVLEI